MAGYTKQRSSWQDFPTTSTPILASNLNGLEQAIFDLKYEKRNVKDYGALGDGSTNDTTAIAAALTDTGWPSNRAAVFFPPGRYVHDGTLTINGGGASSTPALDLYGYGAELYTTTASANPIVSVTNSVTSATHVRFHGITFQPNCVRTAVKLNNAELTKFTNCVFVGNFALGIETAGTSCTYTQIHGCDFTNLARALKLEGAHYAQITGCTFGEQLAGTPLNWIDSSNAGLPTQSVTISGCVFYGTGATLGVIRVTQGSSWTITGCTFDHSDVEAIWIGNDGSSYGHSITGCTFNNGKRHDIYIDGGRRNSVTGNVFNVRAGGVAADTFANVRILNTFGGAAGSDNIVVGNNSLDTASGLSNVVVADAGCVGLVVENNLGAAGISVPGNFPAVASATTITVPIGAKVVSVTGTTTITSVTAGYAGQQVTLVFAGILTFTDGSNLKLAGNFVTTADDTITLMCDGTNWFEVCRSVN